MRLASLTVNNIGLYRGQHHFDLGPRRDAQREMPLTIVTGHNGAGKSTLFQAIGTALHGRQAFGERVTEAAYSEFILNRMHRQNGADGPRHAEQAGVTLVIDYVESGVRRKLVISRAWFRRGRTVHERLTIRTGEARPDVPDTDLQAWLNDLIPPSIAPLCFFDAERLDALAAPERHNALVGSILYRLLGLDLADRLVGDLNHYVASRANKAQREQWRRDLLENQAALQALRPRLADLGHEQREAGDRRKAVEEELAEAEDALAAAGGHYSARRPALQQRLAELEEGIAAAEGDLREQVAGLLPFTLAAGVLASLNQTLEREAERARRQAAGELWQQRLHAVAVRLRNDSLWDGLAVPERTRRKVTERILAVIRDDPAEHVQPEPVHRLSDDDLQRVREWSQQVTGEVPRALEGTRVRLEGLQRQAEEVRTDLERAPDEAVLQPLHERVATLRVQLGEAVRREMETEERLRVMLNRAEEHERKLRKAEEESQRATRADRQVELAGRNRLVLRTYKDALLRQRLQQLEEALVESFNRVCQKDQLLRGALFDPDAFSVQLRSADGHDYRLSSLSAGERQLYALALLDALRRVSRTEFPLLIDTPMARLDERHRSRVLHQYLPRVSPQVVLFATDAEMDAGLLDEAEPYTGRIYRLGYDPAAQQTVVQRQGVLNGIIPVVCVPLALEAAHVP